MLCALNSLICTNTQNEVNNRGPIFPQTWEEERMLDQKGVRSPQLCTYVPVHVFVSQGGATFRFSIASLSSMQGPVRSQQQTGGQYFPLRTDGCVPTEASVKGSV